MVYSNDYIKDRLFASTMVSVHHWLLTYCKVERDKMVNCSCILLSYFCYKRLLKYSLATISQAATCQVRLQEGNSSWGAWPQ